MSYDTPGVRPLPTVDEPRTALQTFILDLLAPGTQHTRAITRRGRPAHLSNAFLSLALLWCVLDGWVSQLDLWRLISSFGLPGFAPVSVCDQAVYKRLGNKGLTLMQTLCAQVTQQLFELSAPFEDRSLAPFASEVIALDESILDPKKRWTNDLRDVPTGSKDLLAGRLSCLFDIRRQCWRRIEFLRSAKANCQVHAKEMIKDLPTKTLLLFDLGYYNFEWFDGLTRSDFWWISRVRSNSSWKLMHVLVQRDGYSEALVFLGAHRRDQSAYLVRLIRIRYRGKWYSWMTNVTDPKQMSGAEVAMMYARRWDVELGFRLLKDHLGLRLLWSAKDEVIGAQIWALVTLSQVLHRLQLDVAKQAGVQTFDVSLELLLRYLSRLDHQAIVQDKGLLEWIVERGPSMGIIRPSTRTSIQAPKIAWQEIILPPPDLVWIREPRYSHHEGAPNRSGKHRKQEKN
jgi:hypothetical protein